MFVQQIDNAIRLAIRRSPVAPVLRRFFRKKLLHQANRIGLQSGWDTAANWLMSDAGHAALADRRFHDALRQGINTDIQTEFLLTALRQRLLRAT